MNITRFIYIRTLPHYLFISIMFLMTSVASLAYAQPKLEKEVSITHNALYFAGKKVSTNFKNNQSKPYNYRFGPQISAHGDAIKKHKNFIFTTWYKGGRLNRNVMLSRYNLITGVLKTIQFPHKHTGLRDSWWIGESHNFISVGVSPKNGSIHLLYDMHAYRNEGIKRNDYFRYSYSVKDAATVADKDFKLNLFVREKEHDYTHVSLNGKADPEQFESLTYPRFFLNDNNDLFMHMRRGGNDNGAYVFSQYNAKTSKWNKLTQLNNINAKRKGLNHNWGLYGSVKYVNGKLRTAFQVRMGNQNDKFKYQNGIYYAYSDDQSGRSQWKDYKGDKFTIPYTNPSIIKLLEPGDFVSGKGKSNVNIVGGFDWTVTNRGDVHIISRVEDTKNNKTVHLHTYKPSNSGRFITSTRFSGGEQIYTAGNNVYIIGLKDSRPLVQRAVGGTNTFETIYESKSGRKFRHGVPYINNGKLYYYLQEHDEPSTSVSLYVQVIDLALPNGKTVKRTQSSGNVGQGSSASASASVSSSRGGQFTTTRIIKTSSSDAKNCHQYTGRARVELDLTRTRCVDISVGLFGNILQISDSIKKSCNFRGKVKTLDGSGTMVVDENIEIRSNMAGKRIIFEPSNGCRAVQIRVR